MEIILKKTKITNAVLKQTLQAGISDITIFYVLGWCVYKDFKWIVLYNYNTVQLRKYLIPKMIIPELDTYNNKYIVRVEFSGNVNQHIYSFDNMDESNKFALRLKTVQDLAESRGQFFI